MRLKNAVLMAAALLAAVPAAGLAQERPIHVNFGGGPNFIGGDLGEHFKTGWGPAIGVTYNVNPKIGVQVEYAYRWFGLHDNLSAAAGVLGAHHNSHQLDFNAVYTLTHPDAPIRGYVLGGPGAYYRSIDITKYEGTGVICDPYWYVCGYYPVSSVIGSRGGWDFGVNFGGGIGFKIGDESEFYIESRFHYVIGPDIQNNGVVGPIPTPTAANTSTHGYYYPLTFGFRF